MTRTQQEIEQIADDFLRTLDHDHGFVQLIRDLDHKTYRLRERFTRQRQLDVNTLVSRIKDELTFYIGLEQDQELEIAIEKLTEHIEYCDCQKFIADSLPECDGYSS